ncbi:MAG: hypothetical protein ACHQYQ_03855 [Bacteriovoracales bacterium]
MKNFILATLILISGLANAQTIYSSKSEKSFKVIPTYGVMTLKSDYENFTSSINAGIAVEKMLSSRFSVGILFNYARFNFNEYDTYGFNNYNDYSGYNYYGYPSYGYNYGYNTSYGQNIKSEIFSIGINSKFFILNEGMFRPFIGGGLTYNRNNLDYDYNTDYGYNYSYNGYNNQYSVSLNSFSGLLMAGTELRFSSTFGINFDFRYIKTLGNNSDYYYSSYSNLEYLGRAMEDSDFMSLNAGILIAI